MLSLNHTFFPRADILKPDGEENAAQYWERFEESWRWRKAQFDSGLVEVTVKGTEPSDVSVPGEDCLSIPSARDMFNDYLVLTGWGEGA